MKVERLKTQEPANRQPVSWLRWLLAWCVHFYTATGLILAAGMAVLIVRGTPADFRGAFFLMLLACVVDSTDGALARLVDVKRVLPGFDGARLDDITDFLTYTFLPLLLIWRAGIMPEGLSWILLLPLVASAYGFCQVWAKTSDGFFVGFPSYWNIVAFYLYALRLSTWANVAILVTLAVLTFVPCRYLYPSQRGLLNRFTALLALIWTALMLWILYRLPANDTGFLTPEYAQLHRWLLISLIFPAYYMLVSWWISIDLWRAARRQPT